MSNLTDSSSFSSSPSCVLYPRSPLLPGIPDHTLGVVLPTLVYIVGSIVFFIFNELEWFSSYRIHPFKDDLYRNRVSRFGCLLNVIRYHIIQIGIGLLLTRNNEPELVGMGACEIFSWAQRVRKCFMAVPLALKLLGLDTQGLALKLHKSPFLSQILANSQNVLSSPVLTTIEWNFARIIVSLVIPAIQFLVYLAVVDTWIYFLHRICHVNKTLYRMYHLSSREYLYFNCSG